MQFLYLVWIFLFLETVMHDSHVEGTPLLILANKQDLQVCCSYLPEFSENLYTITAFCCVYVQLVLFEILSILGAKPELKVHIILLNQSSVQKTFLSTEWHNSVQVMQNSQEFNAVLWHLSILTQFQTYEWCLEAFLCQVKCQNTQNTWRKEAVLRQPNIFLWLSRLI